MEKLCLRRREVSLFRVSEEREKEKTLCMPGWDECIYQFPDFLLSWPPLWSSKILWLIGSQVYLCKYTKKNPTKHQIWQEEHLNHISPSASAKVRLCPDNLDFCGGFFIITLQVSLMMMHWHFPTVTKQMHFAAALAIQLSPASQFDPLFELSWMTMNTGFPYFTLYLCF